MNRPLPCLLVLAAAMGLSLRTDAVRAADHPAILTPPPAPQPRINGAKVFGVRPGHPLLYTIAATGQRPMKYSVAGLPQGLRLDEATGQITGSVARRGSCRVTLRAENALGHAERELRIVVGDELLLTPLLGCNTWGGWGPRVTDANLRAAAKAMVDSGLIQHGWQYVNIDDGWQGERGGPGRAIQPNEKFPDMRGLCDHIHALGLKAGIYSTPWKTSYAGFVGGSSDDPQGGWQRPKRPRDGWHCGKHFFEAADARQWAEWGFDYAKYDWGVDSVELTRRMADALGGCDRDIVLELSNSVPLAQAADHTRLAQLSRTTGDLVDLWDRSQMDAGLRRWAVGIREVWLAHDAWAPHQRPGHWNHACNLRIGLLGGWRDQPLAPSRLTPDEQYSHVSLWCLWGSPMIIGTPIERLDPFTLSLLSNDEVLEVNQDPLGRQARPVQAEGGEALVKPMEDGTRAVGLFNPGDRPARVSVTWSTLGLQGPQRVRDLWRQQDRGVHATGFAAEIASHGVMLVRLAPAPAAPHPVAKPSPADWLQEARLGAFMHFLPGDAAGFARVNDFDVEALARQLEEMGAKYFVFTLGQNSGWFNAPNAVYDRVTGYQPGERCSRRDLPLDLSRALGAKGIRLMLYLPCQTPNQDVRAQGAFGLKQGPKDQPIDLAFATRWAEVINEWSARYGDKVSGWWFDGGYAWVGFNEDVARVYADAVKRGNPQAIVTFNPGVRLIRHTKAEDYTAGELNDPFGVVPASRWVDGSQWHAITFLGSTWGRRDVRHPTERWREWFGKVAARGGAVTLDMGPNWDPKAGPIGAIAPAQARQFREIARP